MLHHSGEFVYIYENIHVLVRDLCELAVQSTEINVANADSWLQEYYEV